MSVSYTHLELARKFVQEQFVAKGMIADLAFHSPEKEDEMCIRDRTDKLDFLFQALVKTSRLETGAIRLEKKDSSLFHTLCLLYTSRCV